MILVSVRLSALAAVVAASHSATPRSTANRFLLSVVVILLLVNSGVHSMWPLFFYERY